MDENSINESITSNIQISQSPLSDICNNFQLSFNKYNTNINNNNRSVSLQRDDLLEEKRLSTTSNRIDSIKDLLNNLQKDVSKDSDINQVLEEQQIFKTYYTTITKSKNNLYELLKIIIGYKVITLLSKDIGNILDNNFSFNNFFLVLASYLLRTVESK